jgi:hypothetical protein
MIWTAADTDFVRGLSYLRAAQRLETWSGDDCTECRLRRLAAIYRERANTLMQGKVRGLQTAAPRK